MAIDKKISELTAILGAAVDGAADLLAVVDVSETETKKILVDEFRTALGLDTMTVASGKGFDFSADTKGIFKGLESIVYRLVNSQTNSDDPLGGGGGDWDISDDTENEDQLGNTGVTIDASVNGVFEFTSTGYWFLTAFCEASINGDDRNMVFGIKASDNGTGGTFTEIAAGKGSVKDQSALGFTTIPAACLIKVSSITNDVIRLFTIFTNAASVAHGNGAANRTYISFTKLADI